MASDSVWPNDYARNPHDLPRKHSNHLICFLACPFRPKERYDELHAFIQTICSQVGTQLGAEVECVRADSLSTPTVIHEDIWTHLQAADAIIADVSERNGNVMLEVGVAASWRQKGQVIIIREEDDTQPFLFDLSPARHILYKRDLYGALEFKNKLARAIIYALAPTPFVPQGYLEPAPPVAFDLTSQPNPEVLLSPSVSHRRRVADGLEFGSLYVFRYSWLTVGRAHYHGVRVDAEMRFTELTPGVTMGDGWIGIMLRSQHFFADYGHLIYVTSDGRVRHTQPLDEWSKGPDDPILGTLPGGLLNQGYWVKFSLTFDDASLRGTVNGVKINIPVSTMPYTYNAGSVRLQTYHARACVRSIHVDLV